MTIEIDDGVEVREVRYVEPDDYTDIVNWLLMGSAMTAKIDAEDGWRALARQIVNLARPYMSEAGFQQFNAEALEIIGFEKTGESVRERGREKRFIPQGMLIAALHIEKLEAEVLKLKQQLHDRSRH